MARWKREAPNVIIYLAVFSALFFPHDAWGRILLAGVIAVELGQMHMALRERAWVVNILDGIHQDSHMLLDIAREWTGRQFPELKANRLDEQPDRWWTWRRIVEYDRRRDLNDDGEEPRPSWRDSTKPWWLERPAERGSHT
jgi:hypothetical protein